MMQTVLSQRVRIKDNFRPLEPRTEDQNVEPQSDEFQTADRRLQSQLLRRGQHDGPVSSV